MDDGGFTPFSSMFANIDLDFSEQLFDEGCWLQTTSSDGSRFFQQNSSPLNAPSFPSQTSLRSEAKSVNLNSTPHQETNSRQQEESAAQSWELVSSSNPFSNTQPKAEEQDLGASEFQDQRQIQPVRSESLLSWEQGSELNAIWIAPRANSGPSTSVQERLMRAIWHFQELNREKELLIQIWVPMRKGLKCFLTTVQQPHFCDAANKALVTYRIVSEKYEFAADEDSKDRLGLPGRVFLGKVPEWTPDVRFFKQDEYPRVAHAQLCNVRGSIALPVFERGSGSCLGVVEIVNTTQKMNYSSEVESVCSALEAVNLQSSNILSLSRIKDGGESCNAELFEIFYTLRTVCDKHGLPLGQTWSPCSQQCNDRCWRTKGNAHCASTINSACYVRDQRVLGFHHACVEHHLHKGQGVVGNAFMTDEPCFATDLTAYRKVEYPLSHHAKIFGIYGSVAIHIRSKRNVCTDYVLELFLPLNCQDSGLAFHFKIMESLSAAVQSSHSLRFLEANELEQEMTLLPDKEVLLSLDWKQSGEEEVKPELSSSKISCEKGTSWISNFVGSQRKGKEVALPIGCHKEPREALSLSATQWSNTEVESQRGIIADSGAGKSDKQLAGTSLLEGEGSSCRTGVPSGTKRVGPKKKTKAQKSISLQVLRQYFAGSLKDAARSIGVCPTTLKRICRQHGIERWPSRKIKKVSHSLKKLQLVMDSVQGAQGAIQLSSFYSNFPELSAPEAAEVNEPSSQQNILPEHIFLSSGGNTSPSTSSSQTSASSHSLSTGAKASPPSNNAQASIIGIKASTSQDPMGSLKRVRSEPELLLTNQKAFTLLERSRSNKTVAENSPTEIRPPILRNSRNVAPADRSIFKVKATFREEKIRLTLTPNMGFASLQQQIAKRFSVEECDKIYIKYLDDDKEWVLLTCDDDLDECVDIQRSSGSQTVKLSVHEVTPSSGVSC